MSRRIANFFSYLFQPLLLATYLGCMLLWLAPATIGSFFNYRIKLWLVLVIFLTTFIVPLIGLVILRLTSSISSFQLPEREERVVPFFFIAIFYSISAYLMVSRLNISGAVNVIFISMASLVFVASFITIFWKISIHSIGMAGVLGFLLALNLETPDSIPVWLVILWILLTGLTMSSRLYLNVHRPGEIYAGAILGLLFSFFSILIFV